MSGFGDYNIKTQIQEDLDCIASQWYGHDTYYMTAEEKVNRHEEHWSCGHKRRHRQVADR